MPPTPPPPSEPSALLLGPDVAAKYAFLRARERRAGPAAWLFLDARAVSDWPHTWDCLDRFLSLRSRAPLKYIVLDHLEFLAPAPAQARLRAAMERAAPAAVPCCWLALAHHSAWIMDALLSRFLVRDFPLPPLRPTPWFLQPLSPDPDDDLWWDLQNARQALRDDSLIALLLPGNP